MIGLASAGHDGLRHSSPMPSILQVPTQNNQREVPTQTNIVADQAKFE
jgi:hypothetical protein